jgi:hypothetical protein
MMSGKMKKFISAGACVALLLTAVGVSALASDNILTDRMEADVSGGDAVITQEQTDAAEVIVAAGDEIAAEDADLPDADETVAEVPAEEPQTEIESGQAEAAVTPAEQTPTVGMINDPNVITAGEEGLHGMLIGEGTAVDADDETRREFDVIAMQIPKNIDFVMDPYNLCGKGLIWSDTYTFRNSGATTVSLKLSDIKCNAKDGIRVAGIDEATEDILNATDKVIRMQLRVDNGETVDITADGSEFEIVMAPGSTFSFNVGGELSRMPETSWMSGDVTISLVYDVQIEKPEEDTVE